MSFASPFTLQHHATVYLDLKDVLVKGSHICGLRACMIFSALRIELLGGHGYACTCCSFMSMQICHVFESEF